MPEWRLPESPALLATKDLGEAAASITIFEKTFAIAFPGNATSGLLRLYTYEDSLVLKQEFKTCPGLDMVTFTPNGKFLLGAGIGAGLGMLLTKRTGKENREILKNSFSKFV
mgnify:CR=1 FL=1